MPGLARDEGEELLAAPRALPQRTALMLLGVAVLALVGVVARQHDVSRSHGLPASTLTTPQRGTASAPALLASDVLLPGRSGFSRDTSGRIVLGASIRNVGATPLTIRYPIVVRGPAHRTLPRLEAGVFSPRTALSSSAGFPAKHRLAVVGAGRTVELNVILDVDCAHRSALTHWPTTPLLALVHASPAVGVATFALTNDDIVMPDQVRSACRTSG